MCRRHGGKGLIARQDRHRIPFWLSLPEGMERMPALVQQLPDPPRAPADVLARAYGMLLAFLVLSPEHRADLHRRGISDEVIARNGFRSWPAARGDRAELARELHRELGDACHGVPGWHVTGDRPMLAGGSGWCFPMWDLGGRVVAIKIRGRDGYYYLSSAKHGGPGAGSHARLAWPGRRPRKGDQAELVRITEGEVKAIVAAEHTGVPTVSCPGVALWRAVLPWLKQIGAQRILLAFDADATTNPNVARALLDAVRALRAKGYPTQIETWS